MRSKHKERLPCIYPQTTERIEWNHHHNNNHQTEEEKWRERKEEKRKEKKEIKKNPREGGKTKK